MSNWVLALVSVALVVGVLGVSVLTASAATEARLLVAGFLLFFAFSLVAGAGLLPPVSVDGDSMGRFETASAAGTRGESR